MSDDNVRKHSGRVDLVGEHKYGDIGQIILFALFVVGVAIDMIFLHSLSSLRESVPILYRIPVAFVAIVISLLLFLHSHRTIFEEVRDEVGVIDTGVYSIVRHPMYLGAITLYLSIEVLTLSGIGLAVFVVSVTFYVFIARFEERLLISRLGDKYRHYMRDVPMFVPRLGRRRSEDPVS
jgi:protein-S-isoprenylcysteine O-methyltransferase Ste14